MGVFILDSRKLSDDFWITEPDRLDVSSHQNGEFLYTESKYRKVFEFAENQGIMYWRKQKLYFPNLHTYGYLCALIFLPLEILLFYFWIPVFDGMG